MSQDSVAANRAPAVKGSVALLAAAFAVAFAVLILVPLWAVLGVLDLEGGHDDHSAASMRAEDFQAQVDRQLERYGQADGSVRPPAGADVFVMVRQFSFSPATIHLDRGEHYNLVFYAADVMHGVSLIMDGSLNVVLMPGTPVPISLQISTPGVVTVRCTEYCGAAHHVMAATILVED